MSISLSRGASAASPAEPRPAPGRVQAAAKAAAARAAALASAAAPCAVVLCVVLAVWQLAADRPGATLPAPTKIWADSAQLIVSPFFDNGGLDRGLGWHLLASLRRVALGFALAGAVGVALGLLIGTSALAMRALDPIFQVLRTVPPLAWLPLSLAAFREAQPSAIFVIFVTAVWPVVINTAVGVRNVPQDYRNVAAVIRLRRAGYFLKIVLPAAAPFVFTGLRIGAGLSWLAIVAAEMLVGGVGIGFFVWDAWNSSNISDIVVALVYVGLTGFALDRLDALAGRIAARGTSA